MNKPKINFNEISINSNNLFLKPLSKENATDLFALYNDEEVQRYTDVDIFKNLGEAQKFIAEYPKIAEKGNYLFLGIFSRATKDFLGTLRLYHIDYKHRFATIGFQLAKDYWGRGQMHESLQAFLKFVFDEMDLHRIEAQTFIENERGIKVLERLKFTREGRLRQNFLIKDKFEDSYLYSLLKTEFLEDKV
ncbi:MAG: GNAT family N-acetyltransferase [Bacteroidales bacterium]|nr:GNAT family N-acetyltransferase [Bacteroidales bacterium]